MTSRVKILLVANTDWYLFNFRLSLAKRLREMGWQVSLVSPPGSFIKSLREEGFRWLVVPLSRRGIFPLSELMTYATLQRIYREESPTLVHHHTIKPNIYGTFAARSVGVPAIVDSITGLGYVFLTDEILGRLLATLIKPLYRKALDHPNISVIFENEGDCDFFLKENMAVAGQFSIIEGVGVDLDRFQPSLEPDGTPIVVLASRMLWDKGVGDYVEAARIIKRKGLQARFVLVGNPDPGNPSSIRRRQLEWWVDEGVVEWWGHRHDMPDVLASCHIVTLPSKAEGTPTVLLEASACARPIVASDIPGSREVVKDGETGLLIRVGDPVSLASGIEELLLNKSLRHEMGKKGRAWVEQRFDQRRINERTIEVYRQALHGK